MLNSSKMLFMMIMILGTMIVCSSETWLGMWMGLEMNLISFIPIIFKSKNSSSSESCMIYFLVQSLGSILLLMSILMNSFITMSPLVSEEFFKMTMMMSLLIKLGIPPFHFWFPEILEKMGWASCLILMTWQKIAPLSIMCSVTNLYITPTIIMMSTIIGAIGGLNQTSIRKILAYSSINHMGWMIACMKYSNELWLYYLTIYITIITMMVLSLSYYSAFFINQLSTISSFTEKCSIIIMFMSLGGLPPFLGFLPKWMVIQTMIMSNNFIIMMIMILSILITLFYYLRLISSTLLISTASIKWTQFTIMNSHLITIMISSNLLLPVITIFSM